jgi:hypothetical protein
MKLLAAAALLATVIWPSATLAQDVDDWDYGEDPAKQLSAAMVEYEGGKTILVQCLAGDLTVAIVGLPQHPSESLRAEVRRPDGRRSLTTWSSRTADVRVSGTPGRTARLLRGGGGLDLASAPNEAPPMRAQFDLPVQSAQLDRVLTACGRALVDERDLRPDGTDHVADLSWSGPIAERLQARTTGQGGLRQAEVSCVIGAGGRLRACQLEQELPSASDYGRAAVAAAEGQAVTLTNAAEAEGTVLHFVLSSNLYGPGERPPGQGRSQRR